MATTRISVRKQTPANRTADTPAAKKTAARRAPAKKTAAKTTAVSLTKSTPALPTRHHEWMTDIQGYATLAARIAGITTPRIRDWRDHRNNTATRRLPDGALLHYNLATRTLTWQGLCPMGATHAYVLAGPSDTTAARVQTACCTQPHADLSTIQPLTADELEALGLLQTPTWARKDLLGEAPTESIPISVVQKPRTLADALAHSHRATADTQPMSAQEIADGLAARAAADNDQMKEHPQP